MAQPFDKVPFQSIKIPQWVESTLGCGYTLSTMDTEHRAAAVAHGVTISEMGFVDPFYPYYDSQLLKRRSPHVPLDRIHKDVAEYRRLGVRILGVYPPCLQSEVYELHPDWRRIATNTTEIPLVDMKTSPHGGMLCLLGPYGDFFISVLEEIATKFPEVDAFSFDGLHYGGVCYCQHCRDNYRGDTQQEIPNANMESLDFRRYQHWADRRMEDLVRRMQMRLKAIKPDLALVTWTTNAGRFGHFLSIPRNMPTRMNLLLDAPDQEFWMDESNRGATILPAITNAYIWATTNHRVAFSEPYLLSHGNPYGKDSFPPHEIARRMLLAATWGAAPSIAVAQPVGLQHELYAVMDQLQRRKPWLTHKQPEHWAAILLSDNTRNFYGRDAGQVEQRYLANVFGTFRACVEAHLPVNFINDWNLNAEDLAEYSVVILPNAACMDDAQIAAIRDYVAQGGGIVSSLDVALCDEIGSVRSKVGLQDVLGLELRGPMPAVAVSAETTSIDVNFAVSIGPDYWEKRKNVFEVQIAEGSPIDRGLMQTYVGRELVTMKGPAVLVEPLKSSKTEIWATHRTKGDPSALVHPALVANQFGKGRSVYFASGFDAAYYLYAYPYQRLAIADAIRWAASKAPPIRVEAPMCVHTTLMRQKEGPSDRLVMHLFNDVNTTAFHALPNEDVPLREETLPIMGVRVTFDSRYRIAKVTQQPEGVELFVKRSETCVEVVVPKLEVHSMLVVELE
jgi:Trehalose utilisation